MKPFLIKNKIFKNFGAYFLQFILAIFVIYFLVLVFLYFYQRSLLYHPNENNLPLGVQLIGDRYDDHRFLGVAKWLEKECNN